jgi:preprotein translocase subunit Sss1
MRIDTPSLEEFLAIVLAILVSWGAIGFLIWLAFRVFG